MNIDDPLYESLRKSLPKIKEDITKITLHSEQKELLEILIHLVQFGSKNKEYDLLIGDFRKKYPATKYSNFSKEYLPNPTYKASITYFLGSKYTLFSQSITNLFDNNLGIAFSMDFCFSKVYFSMYMEGGSMKLLQPITLPNDNGDTHNFNIGSSFTRMDIGFKTGYYVIRNEKVHLAPYVTLLAGGFLESNLYNTENEYNKEFKIYDSFTPGVGLHFEYKLGSYKIKNYYQNIYSLGNTSYFSLKFDAGFETISKLKYMSLTANKTYMTLGIVWGMGNF